MDPTCRDTIETLCARIDQTAAIARMLSRIGEGDLEMLTVVRGIAETLTDIAERLDAALSPNAYAPEGR